MAAGVVSGTLALVVEANRTAFPNAPPLTPTALKAILQFTALKAHDEHGAEYDWLTQGAGVVNPAGAIELAEQIDALARRLVLVADRQRRRRDDDRRRDVLLESEHRLGQRHRLGTHSVHE